MEGEEEKQEYIRWWNPRDSLLSLPLAKVSLGDATPPEAGKGRRDGEKEE